jgi:recombination protein RecR
MKKLMDEFEKMPGIGPHSAQRLTSYILSAPKADVEKLIRRIQEVKSNVRFCKKCNNLSETEICSICSDNRRDKSVICVVEDPSGVSSLEKTGAYNGLYHVLLGELSPIDGVGPEDLKIESLIKRLETEAIREVIIATDFTTEGETTALYLNKLLSPQNIKLTRLARGVPVGGSLEYADIATLQRAMEERRKL